MKKSLALLIFPFLFCFPGCEANRSGDGSVKKGGEAQPAKEGPKGEAERPAGEQPAESESSASKEGSHPAPEEAATALVEGVVASLGRGAYSEFREFTCLGMGKEAFKNFENGIRDSKVTRVWDGATDDFVAGMEDRLESSFKKTLQTGERLPGWAWGEAELKKVEFEGGDVTALLSCQNREIMLVLDDCFHTPQGLLMFDAMRHGEVPNPARLQRKGNFPKLSPFTEVSCHEAEVLVTLSGKRYELISIDGLSTPDMVEFCRKTYGGAWEKRFSEDLVEVMAGMGKPAGVTVKLVVRDIGGEDLLTVPEAPMTAENRRAVWDNRHQ